MYSSSLPLVTTLVAMSRTKGRSLPVGTAMLIGLVPSTASLPKVGTTSVAELVMEIPIRSFSRAIMA